MSAPRPARSAAGAGRAGPVRAARIGAALAALVLSLFAGSLAGARAGEDVATFSIVAFDPETGDLGVGVQSRYFGVGTVVPHGRAGAGAIATQAVGNPEHAREGLPMLATGMPAPEVLDRLIAADPGRDRRQVGVVDARGRATTYTGAEALPWAGGRTGSHYAVQGNILAGPEVLEAMAAAFEVGRGDLAARIVAALKAGQAAGGDLRGRQSAALLVVREGAGYMGLDDRLYDLRVADHPAPIRELARLLRLRRSQRASVQAAEHLERAAEAGAAERRQALAAQAGDLAGHATRLDPRNDWAWLLLARTHLAADRRAEAARAAARALRLNPALKRMDARTRGELGLPPAMLSALLDLEAFRRLWEALPEDRPRPAPGTGEALSGPDPKL